MEKKGRPQRMEWSWARFTITAVADQPTEEVRCPFLTKLSLTTVCIISASVAVESRIRNGFITGRLNHCSE